MPLRYARTKITTIGEAMAKSSAGWYARIGTSSITATQIANARQNQWILLCAAQIATSP
jgi:hypothetical protein